ncbi:MAG: glucosidase [Gemmataceae bacterium]
MNSEQQRIDECYNDNIPWLKWGPYLSERQWGTVREDYSPHGNAWDYFPHDMARSRAYRWGEDGIAGFSDDQQRICLSLALWNGHDPILKERLFGLTGNEGNHGEDVKEHYYYLDATPTSSYLKMLYKYPQTEYPYEWLVSENRNRGKQAAEFELIDTGVFDDDRYFDVVVEYAKAGPDDILVLITAYNRGPDEAELYLLPQVWFRNIWSWGHNTHEPKPTMEQTGHSVHVNHPDTGKYWLAFEAEAKLLFCDNDTNAVRVYGMSPNGQYFKDAFHEYLVHDNASAVNPTHRGTKCAGLHHRKIPAGATQTVRFRLSQDEHNDPFANFANLLDQRRLEADAFYADLQKDITNPDAKAVQRQAFAGMIWTKQFYHYDIPEWLHGDPGQPKPPPERLQGRNWKWEHLNNADVISMPDKWEYPWYAAWDLAFHCVPLALVDPEFAKNQLLLLTREWYMDPNGQLPAYEWAFGDVNPPVHAWATWRVYEIDRDRRGGQGDREFLERVFHKLLLNFTWWVNRKDVNERNVFQGGFLGLDNIGVFDRSAPIAGGGYLDQADGTSWMAMFCLNMLRIGLELAIENRVYEDIATKFFEHFLYISKAINQDGVDHIGLWDEEDEFYYDILHLPNRPSRRLKVRSLVGLTPLFAVETLDPSLLEQVPEFTRRLEWFLNYRPDLANLISRWHEPGRGECRLLSLLRGHRMKRLLSRMLDPSEFLSEFGVRALSRYHKDHPYVLRCDGELIHCNGQPLQVDYQPAESNTNLFGGNSNWRGPIWFPVNYLLIESIRKFHSYYSDDFKVECPTGSGQFVTLKEIADDLSRRLVSIFLKDHEGKRPVFRQYPQIQTDPHFRDHVLFYEYFHGDNGRGVGASHQTGWTGIVAELIQRL